VWSVHAAVAVEQAIQHPISSKRWPLQAIQPLSSSEPWPLQVPYRPRCTVDAWGQVCLAVIDPGIRKAISDAGEPGLVLGH